MSASNKSLLFLLGLVLGLLAGAGFFIFKMDELLKRGNVAGSSRDTLVIQQQVVNKEEEKKNNRSGNGTKDTSKRTMTSAELLAKKYSREVPARRIMAEADSLLRDTLAGGSQQQEEFVVRKDELLSTRNTEVINLRSETTISNDSLLEKISGIRNNKNIVASFRVEFWQSPINYKGYKMTKNKLVLFGFAAEESIRLYNDGEQTYLRQGNNYYRLSFTDEYKQFEKIADPAVTGKLK